MTIPAGEALAATTAVALGATEVERAIMGPATIEPTAPSVSRAGAMMFRFVRMIILHAFTEVVSPRHGLGGPHDTSLVVTFLRPVFGLLHKV
jgi:hypothetical protein